MQDSKEAEKIFGVPENLWALSPVVAAEKRIKLARTGIKLHITDTEYALSGRQPRLRHTIQCNSCGEIFKIWKQERVKCPVCGYTAEMWLMEREYTERKAG